MVKVRVRGSATGFSTQRSRLYLAWILMQILKVVCNPRESAEDVAHNIENFRNLWYSIGGEFTERNDTQKATDIINIASRATRL